MPLKVVQRPRSPFWYLRGSVRGIRVTESTGTADRGAAEEIRIKRENELLQQSIHGRRATATFAEAVVIYLEAGGSKRFMKKPLDYFAGIALSKIGLDEIDIGSRVSYPKVSPATRNRQFVTPVVAVLRHAARRGLCPMPIVARPKQKPGVVRYLTLDEFERLLAAAAPHMKPLMVFLFYTGARAGEALWLDWRQVDLARGQVNFEKTKNGQARGVPLHPRVITELSNLEHRHGEVFRRPDGQPYAKPRSLNDTSAGSRISTAFKAACRRASIENFRVHDCRHTWATWHYSTNRDLGALMRLGGWKSEAMVLRYAHTNVGELAHTILSLPWIQSGDSETARKEKA